MELKAGCADQDQRWARWLCSSHLLPQLNFWQCPCGNYHQDQLQWAPWWWLGSQSLPNPWGHNLRWGAWRGCPYTSPASWKWRHPCEEHHFPQHAYWDHKQEEAYIPVLQCWGTRDWDSLPWTMREPQPVRWARLAGKTCDAEHHRHRLQLLKWWYCLEFLCFATFMALH